MINYNKMIVMVIIMGTYNSLKDSGIAYIK